MNSSQKILIISPFFFPEPISTGKFNTDMVLKLRDKGHQVTVLCSHPFYPDWQTKYSNDQLEGIKIIRGGKKIKYPKNILLRRAVLEIWYAFFVIRKIQKIQKKMDIIIPIFPPSFPFYMTLFFLNKRIKKIGIVHDLQIVFSQKNKSFLNKIVSFLIKKIEKQCFKQCDKLIFLSEEMKNVALEVYNLRGLTCQVQYPFVTIKEKFSSKNLQDILPQNQQNIVYSGALGEKQNPYELYQVFNKITQNISNTCCYFFSQGPIFKELEKKNLNRKILFYPLVSKEDIEELYDRSSIQIVPQLPNTSKGSLPSKLPNILASGTKILVITDENSELEKIFIDNNLNEVITSWDHGIIITSIKKLLTTQVDINKQKNIAFELFNINSLIGKIIT